MTIKNKDGSTCSYSKIPQAMEEQSFWDKKESVILHNKFGEKHFREGSDEIINPVIKELKMVDLQEVIKQKEDQITIVKAIEESKHKPLGMDIIEVWCLPCFSYEENVDPLYDESYSRIKYGETFKFKTKLKELEDLYIQFVTELEVKLPMESVIYPITKNRRWWRIKGIKEIKGYNVYIGTISDYQPSFSEESN